MITEPITKKIVSSMSIGVFGGGRGSKISVAQFDAVQLVIEMRIGSAQPAWHGHNFQWKNPIKLSLCRSHVNNLLVIPVFN